LASIRNDIQALRGLAVSLVVLDHFHIGPFASGFLGVDVFFVISGFLITGIITRDIDAGRFSFRDFYFRRAKRLLPAAYVTIALTVIGSYWFLASVESRDLTAQVIGSLTFSVNFVLYSQIDYFASDAALKPLLHMWSLAIEEQFYLLFPAFLFFIPSRHRMAALLLLVSASAAFCSWLVYVDQALAFYMLPTRAWELGLGAVGAVLVRMQWFVGPRLNWAIYPAAVALLIVPVLSDIGAHPGFAAAGVCVATLVVILVQHPALQTSRILLPMVWLGNISYSLYLVHWPVAAFLNNAYIGDQPIDLRLLGLALSLTLAVLLYYLVENPARRSSITLKYAAGVGGSVSACIALIQVVLVAASPTAETFRELRKPNHGFDASCDGPALFENAKCQSGPNPEILVWGDSYAMHLVPGIVAASVVDVVQATMSSCSPVPGVTRDRPARWVERCMRANEKTFRTAVADKNIHTIVLSSPFYGLQRNVTAWEDKNGKLERGRVKSAEIRERFRELITELRDAGKRVIFVGPPPNLGGVDFSVCVERKHSGKITFGNSDCTIDREDAAAAMGGTLNFIDYIRRSTDLDYVDLFDALCTKSTCATELEGVPVYRDNGHLSQPGSIEVIGRLPEVLWHVEGSASAARLR
jgi:peptidoglycan/LPS O-acetylase OafA/YrhL